MNKSVSRIMCLLLSMMTAFSLVACGGGGGETSSSSTPSSDKGPSKYDTETRPVKFAIESLDGTFNPFYATSAGDSEMVGLTQLGMLTTDNNGNIICGENEPTVALDYDYKTVTEGDKTFTDYQFIIKNGIKFSDGVDLTIKDILFNLYVYLDPAYTGSATLYSTKIVGLNNYRNQTLDDTDFNFNKQFEDAADARITKIINYLDPKEDEGYDKETVDQIKEDIQLTKTLFRDETETDWSSSEGSLEGLKDEYAFTEAWEAYYYMYGFVRPLSDNQGPLRDENGKYITNLTPADVMLDRGYKYDGADYNPEYANEIAAAKADQTKIKEYTDQGVSQADAEKFVVRDFAIATMYTSMTETDLFIPQILLGWATGDNVRTQFIGEARTEFYENLKNDDGSLKIETISGITTDKTDVGFDGEDLGETHDVLKIRIKGVDPKAIYNFSFGVAPMHYYSGTYEGVDYVAKAREDTMDDGKVTNFGVKFNTFNFFSSVVKSSAKNKLPVGAGAYKASNIRYDEENIEGKDFYSNGWVYFCRNNYFETVGEKIENAKIKYLRYQVLTSDAVINALLQNEIDVGEPNAKPENIKKITDSDNLYQKTVTTNGYGYVGINAAFVPDIEVRKAIMTAMNPRFCIGYYTEEYANILYRAMSDESWIWNYVDKETKPKYALETSAKAIQDKLVATGRYKVGTDGKLVDKNTNKKLKYTFTIAGATTDHPAYDMFMEAQTLLNEAGFEITVTKDIQALKKLATGSLEVWAAAWSSTVDPDMYQVYHSQSNATSILNWGYKAMEDDEEEFYDELQIRAQLDKLIEQGRETNDQEARAKIYKQALNLVMDLAVEMPTYQRKDCVAYNKHVIDASSLNQNPTPFAGVIDKIWELDYN